MARPRIDPRNTRAHQVCVYLGAEMHEWVLLEARKRRKNRSEFLRNLLREERARENYRIKLIEAKNAR